ncbi:trehalose operon repressor [Halonatronum saccharophilum]|uniref:trehalose operon repressor n=1 Tax=Halonatronum saccharophilum TaxID=150060 RepID=UPI000485FAD7|nr:trehalose operon repressor [Halonatronum saccharophilum]
MNNKYLKIYNEIVKKIESGEIKSNTHLPSENTLSKDYKSSRGTIRKALNLLAQNGYIQKIQGKGSIVLDINKFDFPISGLVSFKELSKKMGQGAKTIVADFELIKGEDYDNEEFGLAKDEKAWRVLRVREIGGHRIILDKDYLKRDLVPSLTEDICSDSIYEYIESKLGLTISFAKKEISVETPSDEDRELLDLDGYDVVVVVKSYVYLEDATLFQYTESKHRPDKFKFVDFARRNH